ncbi:dehydrogenase [Paenibacillus swuensis]|uniref:Dehydrogenase n=1 Tax=Paenibacillus swuensis TaxID=1178515 RepID=A0A172TNZ6_9BACL|nr:Gfo/Idh/MocA family oxidoreductase [Paenibacillus swuensis]ANE48537.1 dehydrogenase [Paenibacillus swuensis]
MWKVGLVGTGFWSDNHLAAWAQIPGAVVTALCDRNPLNLRQKALAFGIPDEQCYTSLEEMLNQGDIDIVDIVTGPETHTELVTLAADAGKHILCQKPLAASEKEASLMVAKAESCGVRFMVTENWRWLEPFRFIKEVLDAGTLGKVQTVRYTHTDYYTPRMAPGAVLPQPFFRDMPRLLFYEMGVHWFDTWRYLFGTPKRIYAETATISPHIAGEDSGIVVLSHEDFYGYMDMSWATRQKLDRPLGQGVKPLHLEQLVIDGTLGTLKLDTSGQILFISEDGTEERVLTSSTTLDHAYSHVLLQSHFIACLDHGTPFQTEGRDNLITLRMTFGVYESAVRHMPILITGGASSP